MLYALSGLIVATMGTPSSLFNAAFVIESLSYVEQPSRLVVQHFQWFDMNLNERQRQSEREKESSFVDRRRPCEPKAN